ncbi:MAG: carbohydrate ABC transporter permease [bacterium]
MRALSRSGRRGGDPFKVEKISGLIFVSPLVIGFLVFSVYPLLASIYLSFTEYKIYIPPIWVAFGNYVNLFHDQRFWIVMRNTLVYTSGNVPLQIVFSLLLASLLNQKLRGIIYFRTAFFVPVVTSWVAAGVCLRWILASDVGLLNYFLSKIGIKGPPWLMEPGWAMVSIIMANLWKGVGFNTMLYLAGLQDIPPELDDAAMVDGATRAQKFFHITIPLLRPTTFFVSTMAIINSFQVFDNVYVMTSGGPMDSTRVIVYHLWETGFMYLRMGEASAIAWVLFALIFSVTFLRWRRSQGGYIS